jgi:nucleotide-binding universal stress UspA family protein
MSRFTHILVPVDFGDATQPALDLALSLAETFDARVTLLYAFDVTPFVAPSAFMLPLDVEPVIASFEKELKSLREKTQAKWAKVDAVLRQGNVYETILDTAKVRGCDLIVMGTHGRRGLSHAVIGSVAEKIVRLASVPVLTVRPRHVEGARAASAA